MSEPQVNNNDPSQQDPMPSTATMAPDTNRDSTQTQIPAPSAQPAAPNTPAAPAAPSTQAAQPRPAQPAQPPTPKSLHASIFEGVLKTLGGGAQYINRTDPSTGEVTREPIQQSKGQLGKSILAGALAGMFGGMGARDAEGRHDPMKAAQEGFQAGQKPMQEQVAKLQGAADADTANRQIVMKNNLDLVHQQMAMTTQNHAMLESTIADNKAGVLADAATYDAALSGVDANDKTKKAIQASGLTHTQALAQLNGHWSDTLAIVSGQQMTKNPTTGVMETEPLYSLLNPNVKVKMSKEQADEFARYKPGYKNAYDLTGGNLKVGLHNYVSDTHEYNSYQHAEASLDRVKDALDSEGVNLAALASGKDGNAIKSAVIDMENASAQGGSIEAILQRLQGTGGGNIILKDMKISDSDIDEYTRAQQSANARAKEGGMGPKAPALQANVDSTNGLIGEIQDPKMRKDFENQIHPNMANSELDGLNKEIRSQLDADRTYAAANPAVDNPQGLIGEDYLTTLPVGKQNMLRGYGTGLLEISPRLAATKQGKALVEQIETAYPGYDVTKALAYAKLRNTITSGADSQGISRGNAAINHAGLFYDHITALSALPGIKTFDKLAAGDAAKLELDRAAVSSELAGAYKGGNAAPTEDEISEWKSKLNGATPDILKVQIKEALHLLKGKIQTYDDKWAAVAPPRVSVPSNVFSQEARKTYARVTGEAQPPRVDDIVTVKGQQVRITSMGQDGTAQVVPVTGAK
jgi:hypothetical protein